MRRTLKFLTYPILLTSLAFATSSFLGSSSDTAAPASGNRTEEIKRHSSQGDIADFTKVAKIGIPAVVSIKVQQNQKKNSPFGDNSQGDELYQLFGNSDLWRMFGLPQGGEGFSKPMMGQASGVIVNPDGHILTNSHVVHNMDKISVQLTDGREFPAKVLGEDPNSDLAVIKIEAQDLPHLTLGNSDELEVGQWVAAIGNPFGLQGTLTAGVVSAKSRNNLDIARYEDFIQTDAAINQGNSGGPLVTLNGEVIGINTAIATTTNSGYLGIGFAIPSNMARHVMDEILSDGKVSRGFLGISLQSIDYNLAQAFGLKKVEGALVANVVKNSAADKAGVQVEDIILKVNDRPVENASVLRNAVYMMKPGTKINLTVLRKDQLITIPVSVGEFSENEAVAAAPAAASQKSRFGIDVGNLTPELAQALGYTQDKGVLITRVNPNSPAGLAGLKKGALILSVNRQNVTNVDEYNRALAQTSEDAPVMFRIKQGDNYIYLSLQMK